MRTFVLVPYFPLFIPVSLSSSHKKEDIEKRMDHSRTPAEHVRGGPLAPQSLLHYSWTATPV